MLELTTLGTHTELMFVLGLVAFVE